MVWSPVPSSRIDSFNVVWARSKVGHVIMLKTSWPLTSESYWEFISLRDRSWATQSTAAWSTRLSSTQMRLVWPSSSLPILIHCRKWVLLRNCWARRTLPSIAVTLLKTIFQSATRSRRRNTTTPLPFEKTASNYGRNLARTSCIHGGGRCQLVHTVTCTCFWLCSSGNKR